MMSELWGDPEKALSRMKTTIKSAQESIKKITMPKFVSPPLSPSDLEHHLPTSKHLTLNTQPNTNPCMSTSFRPQKTTTNISSVKMTRMKCLHQVQPSKLPKCWENQGNPLSLLCEIMHSEEWINIISLVILEAKNPDFFNYIRTNEKYKISEHIPNIINTQLHNYTTSHPNSRDQPGRRRLPSSEKTHIKALGNLVLFLLRPIYFHAFTTTHTMVSGARVTLWW